MRPTLSWEGGQVKLTAVSGSEHMVDGEWLNLGIIERVVMQRFVDRPNGLVLK